MALLLLYAMVQWVTLYQHTVCQRSTLVHVYTVSISAYTDSAVYMYQWLLRWYDVVVDMLTLDVHPR